jgi:2'-5' RNA ligase
VLPHDFLYKKADLFYNPSMRLFIGIKLPADAIENVEKFLKPFKKIGTPIRWTKTENIHVTLKFIGEVTPEKYAQIENVLTGTPFNTGTFDLSLAGCGKFGKGGDLNIFWIGIAPCGPLETIYNKLEESLAKIGIKKEDRAFKPHITVGRNKKNFNFKSLFQLIDENKDRPIAQFPVTHFQLFESRLTPEGPIYNLLKEIPVAEA